MAKTFADLKSDIADWNHRGDLTTVIPLLVKLAEEDIFKTHDTPIRVREMETEANITLTSLVGSLPSDYLEAKYIRMENSSSVATMFYYVPPEKWSLSESGYFTIIGSSVKMPTGASGTCKIVYYAKPAALSADADTNTVLDSYYSVYLLASLKQASIWQKNTEFVASYDALLRAKISDSNKNNKAHAGPLFVRAA